MKTIQDFKELSNKIDGSVVSVEEYSLDKQVNICFFSYRFDRKADDKYFYKIVYFRKPQSDKEWGNVKELTVSKVIRDESKPVSEISWKNENNSIVDGEEKRLTNTLDAHLQELDIYIKGKNFSPTAKKYRKENSWLIALNTLYEIGLFGGNAWLAAEDSSKENKIKDNAKRKAIAQPEVKEGEKVTVSKINTTMSLTAEVLSNIVVPTITGPKLKADGTPDLGTTEDKRLKVELDGAFRISYKP